MTEGIGRRRNACQNGLRPVAEPHKKGRFSSYGFLLAEIAEEDRLNIEIFRT